MQQTRNALILLATFIQKIIFGNVCLVFNFALVNAAVLKEHGINCIMDPIVEDIKKLEAVKYITNLLHKHSLIQ